MFPGALLGKWGRDREPDGAYGFLLMIPTGMESNYSVQVPWEAVDKTSMFSAFISTRCNNKANRIIASMILVQRLSMGPLGLFITYLD